MRIGIDRRNFINAAIGACISPFAIGDRISTAMAQSSQPDLVASLSRALQDLEHKANVLGLHATDRTRSGITAELNNANLYIEGMPRLVDLIERSSVQTSEEIANQAAQLLSEINDREKTIPEWFAFPRRTRGPKPSFNILKKDYMESFKNCKTRPEYNGVVNWHIQTILRYQSRYESLAQKVSIPWYFIGIVHGLEASFNFLAHLHNGDAPLTKKTTHVPINRPAPWLPPSDWQSSAVDALTQQGFVGKVDWSLERMLYRWENYNGFGYRAKKIPSPYLWSFSNNYAAGKFVKDGKFDGAAVSKQCGAAVLLKGLLNSGVVTL